MDGKLNKLKRECWLKFRTEVRFLAWFCIYYTCQAVLNSVTLKWIYPRCCCLIDLDDRQRQGPQKFASFPGLKQLVTISVNQSFHRNSKILRNRDKKIMKYIQIVTLQSRLFNRYRTRWLLFIRIFWLVVLRLNVPVNNFSVMSGRSHRFLGN